MKIFYSWQSDTPNNIGRGFVRDALDRAIDTLAREQQLDEADRPTVDQDTQGILGAPPIAEVIFEKIRDSEVVVLDTTLVGGTPDGKKLINSNVAIELGYSLGFHGDRVLLMLMNTHYGDPTDLPFDLLHRRRPIQYYLSPEDPLEVKRACRDKLVKELARVLGEFANSVSEDSLQEFEPTTSSINPACYWDIGKPLVKRIDGDRFYSEAEREGISYGEDDPLVYLRIWPDSPLPPLTGNELRDFGLTGIEPLLGRTSGYSFVRNKYGTLTYAYSETADQLMATTQVMKNREIWGVNNSIVARRDREFDFVPSGAFEKGVRRSLHTYLGAAKEFGYPNHVHVEGGLVNVEDFRIAVPSNEYRGSIFENNVCVTTRLDHADYASIDRALLTIFEEVFESAGLSRPEALYS